VEEDLRRLLDELRDAIGRAGHSDEDRAELNRLADAVEHRLNQDDPEAEAGNGEEHHHLVGSLEAAALRFEAEHPVLGEALLRAVDTLSAAGI
jgi:hypothetical protein